MFNEELLELYYLCEEETKIKKKLSEIKSSMKDVKENIDEIKAKIIEGMVESNHKYAKYKNMCITLERRPIKIKPKQDEIHELIGSIIEMNLDTTEKCEKIIKALKPHETGEYTEILNVKIEKEK